MNRIPLRQLTGLLVGFILLCCMGDLQAIPRGKMFSGSEQRVLQVELHMKDQPLKSVFNEIQRQTDYTFVEEVRVDRREDYMQFIPYEIPEEFTAKDFAACAKIPVRLAQTVLLLLTDLLIVERIGKQGRSYLYRICEIE